MFQHLIQGIKNYPVSFIAALAATTIAMFIPSSDISDTTLFTPLLTALLVIPLGVSCSTLFGCSRLSLLWKSLFWVTIVVLLYAIMYPLGLPDTASSMKTGLTFFLLLTMGISSTFLLPIASKSSTEELSWEYIKQLVFHYVVALAAALFVALASNLLVAFANTLFEVFNPDGIFYFRLNAIIFAGLLPLYLIALFPDSSAIKTHTLPTLLHHIALWVVSPVALLYAIILLINFSILLITGTTAEESLLGPILIYFGIFFTALYALYPLLNKGVSKYLVALITVVNGIFITMGTWAIALRISEYGITVPRYISSTMLLGCFLLGVMTLCRRWTPLRYHPLVPVILLLIASISPINAFESTIMSQKSIVYSTLQGDRLSGEGKLLSYDLSESEIGEMDRLRSALMTIVEHGGSTEEFDRYAPEGSSNLYTYVTGIQYPNGNRGPQCAQDIYLDYTQGQFLSTTKEGVIIPSLQVSSYGSTEVDTPYGMLTIPGGQTVDNRVKILISTDEVNEELDLTNQLSRLFEENCKDFTDSLRSKEEMTLSGETANYNMTVLIQNMNSYEDIYNGNLLLFIHKK